MDRSITWKNVFNTAHKRYRDFAQAEDIALECGYPYIAWNDRVYDTSSYIELGTLEKLGLVEKNTTKREF